MKTEFNCPENKNTKLIVNGEYDDFKLISVMGDWENGFRRETIVCLEGEELARFKKAVAEL